MSGLNGPTRPIIKLDYGAVVVGFGALAPHLVEAKTFSGFAGVEVGHEFA